MAVTARVQELSAGEKQRKRPFAVIWMVAVVVISGTSIALKKPTFAPYPGTVNTSVMFIATYTAISYVIGFLLKLPVIVGGGPWLERKLHGDSRQVRIRDIFSRNIRADAMFGGVLTAFYYMLFYGLVNYLSPAALASARACVIIPLGLLEWHMRNITPSHTGWRRWWARLFGSGALTLIGASIVIFDGGFKLFKQGGAVPVVLLLLLVTVGNAVLAYAEIRENRGVRDATVASPVYSMARVMYGTLTAVVFMAIWGLTHFGDFGMAWHVLLMCIDRWYLVVPIALVGALVDMSRMCVKVIIPATFMYILMAAVAVWDVLLQTVLKYTWSSMYDTVKEFGWHTARAVGAALVIALGALMFPHVKQRITKT